MAPGPSKPKSTATVALNNSLDIASNQMPCSGAVADLLVLSPQSSLNHHLSRSGYLHVLNHQSVSARFESLQSAKGLLKNLHHARRHTR